MTEDIGRLDESIDTVVHYPPKAEKWMGHDQVTV